MPKIFNTNLLGILAATIAFFMVGWLFYGGIFANMWHELTGVPKPEGMEMGVMAKGFLITLIQVVGLAYILNHAGASTLATCVKVCATIAVLLALPLMAYNTIYQGSHVNLLGIDFLHLLVGYSLVGAVLSFFKGKDAIGEA